MMDSSTCTLCGKEPECHFHLKGVKMVEGVPHPYQICHDCANSMGRMNPYDHKLTNERKAFWDNVAEKI